MKPGRKNPQKSSPAFFDRFDLCFISTSRRVDGLWIGASRSNGEIALRRVEEALHLIKTHDLRRYGRLLRDLERIWVRSDRIGTAWFNEALKACELSEDFVLADTSPAEEIAAAIVHEATHARLWSHGIGYDEPLRQRIEAACVRRELAFAARLPNGEPVRERARRTLEWICNTPHYWTDAAFVERKLEHDVQVLRRLGTPEWVVRVTLRLRALRLGTTDLADNIGRRLRAASALNSP